MKFMCTSIGSLGKDNSTGIVTMVVLDTAFLRETTNGLRIKTWQVVPILHQQKNYPLGESKIILFFIFILGSRGVVDLVSGTLNRIRSKLAWEIAENKFEKEFIDALTQHLTSFPIPVTYLYTCVTEYISSQVIGK